MAEMATAGLGVKVTLDSSQMEQALSAVSKHLDAMGKSLSKTTSSIDSMAKKLTSAGNNSNKAMGNLSKAINSLAISTRSNTTAIQAMTRALNAQQKQGVTSAAVINNYNVKLQDSRKVVNDFSNTTKQSISVHQTHNETLKQSIDINTKYSESIKNTINAMQRNTQQNTVNIRNQNAANQARREGAKAANEERIALTAGAESAGRSAQAYAATTAQIMGMVYAMRSFLRPAMEVMEKMDAISASYSRIMGANVGSAFVGTATNKMLKESTDIAYQYGASITDVAGVMVEFARQGRSERDILNLTRRLGELRLMLATSTGQFMSMNEAMQSATTLMTQMDLTVEQAIKAMELMSEYDIRAATSFDQISQAMTRFAAAGQVAGMSTEEIIKVATAFTEIGVGGSRAGTALNTIISRLSGTKAAIEAVQNLGVSMTVVENGSVRATSAIEQLVEAYKKVIATGDRAQLNQFLSAVAGTRQRSVLAAGLNRYIKQTASILPANEVATLIRSLQSELERTATNVIAREVETNLGGQNRVFDADRIKKTVTENIQALIKDIESEFKRTGSVSPINMESLLGRWFNATPDEVTAIVNQNKELFSTLEGQISQFMVQVESPFTRIQRLAEATTSELEKQRKAALETMQNTIAVQRSRIQTQWESAFLSPSLIEGLKGAIVGSGDIMSGLTTVLTKILEVLIAFPGSGRLLGLAGTSLLTAGAIKGTIGIGSWLAGLGGGVATGAAAGAAGGGILATLTGSLPMLTAAIFALSAAGWFFQWLSGDGEADVKALDEAFQRLRDSTKDLDESQKSLGEALRAQTTSSDKLLQNQTIRTALMGQLGQSSRYQGLSPSARDAQVAVDYDKAEAAYARYVDSIIARASTIKNQDEAARVVEAMKGKFQFIAEYMGLAEDDAKTFAADMARLGKALNVDLEEIEKQERETIKTNSRSLQNARIRQRDLQSKLFGNAENAQQYYSRDRSRTFLNEQYQSALYNPTAEGSSELQRVMAQFKEVFNILGNSIKNASNGIQAFPKMAAILNEDNALTRMASQNGIKMDDVLASSSATQFIETLKELFLIALEKRDQDALNVLIDALKSTGTVGADTLSNRNFLGRVNEAQGLDTQVESFSKGISSFSEEGMKLVDAEIETAKKNIETINGQLKDIQEGESYKTLYAEGKIKEGNAALQREIEAQGKLVTSYTDLLEKMKERTRLLYLKTLETTLTTGDNPVIPSEMQQGLTEFAANSGQIQSLYQEVMTYLEQNGLQDMADSIKDSLDATAKTLGLAKLSPEELAQQQTKIDDAKRDMLAAVDEYAKAFNTLAAAEKDLANDPKNDEKIKAAQDARDVLDKKRAAMLKAVETLHATINVGVSIANAIATAMAKVLDDLGEKSEKWTAELGRLQTQTKETATKTKETAKKVVTGETKQEAAVQAGAPIDATTTKPGKTPTIVASVESASKDPRVVEAEKERDAAKAQAKAAQKQLDAYKAALARANKSKTRADSGKAERDLLRQIQEEHNERLADIQLLYQTIRDEEGNIIGYMNRVGGIDYQKAAIAEQWQYVEALKKVAAQTTKNEKDRARANRVLAQEIAKAHKQELELESYQNRMETNRLNYQLSDLEKSYTLAIDLSDLDKANEKLAEMYELRRKVQALEWDNAVKTNGDELSLQVLAEKQRKENLEYSLRVMKQMIEAEKKLLDLTQQVSKAQNVGRDIRLSLQQSSPWLYTNSTSGQQYLQANASAQMAEIARRQADIELRQTHELFQKQRDEAYKKSVERLEEDIKNKRQADPEHFTDQMADALRERNQEDFWGETEKLWKSEVSSSLDKLNSELSDILSNSVNLENTPWRHKWWDPIFKKWRRMTTEDIPSIVADLAVLTRQAYDDPMSVITEYGSKELADKMQNFSIEEQRSKAQSIINTQVRPQVERNIQQITAEYKKFLDEIHDALYEGWDEGFNIGYEYGFTSEGWNQIREAIKKRIATTLNKRIQQVLGTQIEKMLKDLFTHDIKEGIEKAASDAVDKASKTTTASAKSSKATLSSDDKTKIAEGVTKAISWLSENVNGSVDLSSIGDSLANLPDLIGSAIAKAPEAITDVIRKAPEKVAEGLSKVPGVIGDTISKTPGMMGDVIEAIGRAAYRMPETIGEAAQKIPETIADAAQKIPETLADAAERAPQEMATAVGNTVDLLAKTISSSKDVLVGSVEEASEALSKAGEELAEVLPKAADETATAVNNTISEVGKTVQTVVDSLSEAAGSASKEAEADLEGEESAIGDLFGSLFSSIFGLLIGWAIGALFTDYEATAREMAEEQAKQQRDSIHSSGFSWSYSEPETSTPYYEFSPPTTQESVKVVRLATTINITTDAAMAMASHRRELEKVCAEIFESYTRAASKTVGAKI